MPPNPPSPLSQRDGKSPLLTIPNHPDPFSANVTLILTPVDYIYSFPVIIGPHYERPHLCTSTRSFFFCNVVLVFGSVTDCCLMGNGMWSANGVGWVTERWKWKSGIIEQSGNNPLGTTN